MRVGLSLLIASVFLVVACAEDRDTKPRKRVIPTKAQQDRGEKVVTESTKELTHVYRFNDDCDTDEQKVTASSDADLKAKLCERLDDSDANNDCSEDLRMEHKEKYCSEEAPAPAPAEEETTSGGTTINDDTDAGLEFLSEEDFRDGKNLVQFDSVMAVEDADGNEAVEVKIKTIEEDANTEQTVLILPEPIAKIAEHYEMANLNGFAGKHIRTDKNSLTEILGEMLAQLEIDSEIEETEAAE